MANSILLSEFPSLAPYKDHILLSYNLFIWVHLSVWDNCMTAKYISCLSFMGLVYISVVLVLQFHNYFPLATEVIAPVKLEKDAFTALSLCTVAFVTPTNVATLQNDLANPIRRRLKKVNLLVIVVQQLLYSVLGVFGFLSTIGRTPELITERQRPTGYIGDVLMDVGRCVMFMALVCDVPTYILPCRKALLQTFNFRESHKSLTISGLLCIIGPAVMMLSHLDVRLLMNLLAAQCAWFFYLVPGLLEVKVSMQAWTAPKNLLWMAVMVSYTGASVMAVWLSL